MTPAEYLDGRLLLAMPGMPDPRFAHSVIAMCAHNAEGALGIGVGHEMTGVRLHALLKDLDIDPGKVADIPVLRGGPVEPQRGFVLHSGEWHSSGTMARSEHWSLTGSRDILEAIAEGKGPQHWLVALGYAGWSAGQLDGEMRHHGWYAAQGWPQVLFDTPTKSRWTASWKAEGIDAALLANVSGHA